MTQVYIFKTIEILQEIEDESVTDTMYAVRKSVLALKNKKR